MTLTLRAKLALAFSLVAAVPLATMQQVASRRVRSKFLADTEARFERWRARVGRHFQAQADAIADRLAQVEKSYGLREQLFRFASATDRTAQSDLIAAVQAAAVEAGLPLLVLCREDGTVLASAQEPWRFDVRDPRVLQLARDSPGRPVLDREEGIDVGGLALKVVAPVDESVGRFWLSAGVLVDGALLDSLPVDESLAFLVVSADGVRTASTAAGQEAAALLAGRALRPGQARAELEAAGWLVGEVELPGIGEPEPVDLLLATPLAPLRATLAELQRTFLGLLLGGLGVAVALAFVLARRWTDPIERLVRGLERVAQGDLSGRVDLRRDDELGRLGRAFDTMTRELGESRERLLEAERTAAWQDIARRLAHEIKNPLSPISLSMEALRRAYAAGRGDFAEMLAESTRTVLEEVERLRRIVQSFSDFARLPRPHLVEHSLHEVLRGVLALHAGHGDRYRFVTDLAPGDGRFVFDIDQVNRLLVNLVQNAIEAMPEGGEVRIATAVDRGRGRFRLTVADTGPGIAAEAARTLFRPYHTSKPGGTGLGLAIVHRIVSEHGGQVWLANPGSPGARFEVELPLDPPRPEEEAGGGQEGPAWRGGRDA